MKIGLMKTVWVEIMGMGTWHSESVQFTSVTQLCPTLCDPMDCSTSGLPVHHQLPELAQSHVHQSVMPSSHLILCDPLLLLRLIFPSIRVFSSESVLRHLYCCPANRFVSIIFLDSISEHILLTQSFSFMKKYLAK